VVRGVARPLRVFPDLDRASAAVAERVAAAAREAVAARGRFRLVLSGGRTPLGLFERWARTPTSLPWPRTDVYFADERAVPPTDPASNFGAAWSALLSRVPIDRHRVHRLRGEVRPLVEAARRYERRLRAVDGGADAPTFDLTLLGIGPDGHTASLFPGQPSVRERRRWVVAVPRAGLPPLVPRLTMTAPALSATRAAVFLVAGADKATALAGTLASAEGGDRRWPATLVRPRRPAEWYVDRSAAAGLSTSATRLRPRAR